MKTKNKSKLHLAAIIIAILSAVLNVIIIISLLTNLFGMRDLYGKVLQSVSTYVVDVDSEINFACLQQGITVIIHIAFAGVLINLYKKATPSVQLGKALVSIACWYMLCTLSLASVFTLIVGWCMGKRNSRPIIAEATVREKTEPKDINEYKMKAMTEAVSRLKELRQSGAISDDEYYATLDKILEG